MRTEPGLVLEGRYALTSLIATGGMGQVWKGQDQELDREVAIKVLREEYAGDEGFLKRFRAEARHTAALSHEGIAALYDYGELDGRAYIVMELCPGRPLSELIEENPGGLPERRVVSLLIELARALDAAHSKGVVHRDVKPENVLVDEQNDWTMKITDFGIARSQEQARLTKTGLVMGTAQYLSPEQAMGKQATSLSDIYALGIVGYEMLVGKRPFTGSSQVDIAMAQVKQKPPALPEAITEDLRTLVMMMLAKAPANRPRSASAVSRILEAIQRGVPPHFSTGAIPVTRVADHDGSGNGRSAGSGASAGTAGSAGSADEASREQAERTSPTGTSTAAMPLPLSGRGRARGIRHRSGASASSGLSASSASSAPHRGLGSSRSARSAGSAASAPSASSAPSAGSARSAGSAPLAPGATPPATASPGGSARSSAPSAGSAPEQSANGAFDGVDTATSSRTVHGTSTTGRTVGGMSFPGVVLVVLVVLVIIAAVLGGLGLLPIGAAPAAPAGALAVVLVGVPSAAPAGAPSAAPTGPGALTGSEEAEPPSTMDGSVDVGHGSRTGAE